jgi:hypothetical protein
MERSAENISGGCENCEARCGVVGETIVKRGEKSIVFCWGSPVVWRCEVFQPIFNRVPEWRNGRRCDLKSVCRKDVRVRLPPSAPLSTFSATTLFLKVAHAHLFVRRSRADGEKDFLIRQVPALTEDEEELRSIAVMWRQQPWNRHRRQLCSLLAVISLRDYSLALLPPRPD